MKQYLYHITSPANVWSILNFGLTRKYGWAVYLCENPRSWWSPGMAVLRVRITGLKGEFKTFGESDEIMYLGDIRPGRISRWIPPRGWYRQWAKDHPDYKPKPLPEPALTREERARRITDYVNNGDIGKEK